MAPSHTFESINSSSSSSLPKITPGRKISLKIRNTKTHIVSFPIPPPPPSLFLGRKPSHWCRGGIYLLSFHCSFFCSIFLFFCAEFRCAQSLPFWSDIRGPWEWVDPAKQALSSVVGLSGMRSEGKESQLSLPDEDIRKNLVWVFFMHVPIHRKL